MNSSHEYSYQLPQTGWLLDTEWAEKLNIEVRQFRRNCRRFNIPRRVFGNTMIVRAEDLFMHSPSDDDSSDDEQE